MLIKISVFLVAIGLGFIMSFIVMYMSKLKEYIVNKKKTGSNYWGIIDLSWRILFTIFFTYIGLIVPIDLMCYLVENKSLVKTLSSIYLFSFVGGLFLSVFVLIRLGKIKIDNELR